MIIGLVPLGPAVADYPPGSTFGPRTTQHFQFVWILHGRATWTCEPVSQEHKPASVALEPGELLLVRPGMIDAFRWDPRRPTRHAYVHFTLDDPSPLPTLDAWPVTRPTSDRDGPLAGLCRYVLWLGDTRPDGWQHRICDALEFMVTTFVAGPLPSDHHRPLPAPIKAVVAYLGRRWSDGVARPVPLGELASAASVSSSTLSRAFRQRFGVGPVAALELIRLARSEPLLSMSNLTLGAVAAQCGFADAYHFSRRFRAVYGIAPTAFRAACSPARDTSPVADAGLKPLYHRISAALIPMMIEGGTGDTRLDPR